MREQLKSSEVANALQAVPMIPFRQLTLIETLGTGRVSTIYKAVWMKDKENRNSYRSQSDQVVVALKVAMVNQETQDTFNIEELRREADIAARLEHPNICRLIGYAEDGDCFCLAYEYCERGSLMSMLSGPNKSKKIDYIPIALDVCAGMAYLHDRRVIHRDLKLANLLITADGRAKVSDFGMSAILIDGRELTAETGTYRYVDVQVQYPF
jgi:serine/threonine protein kinase